VSEEQARRVGLNEAIFRQVNEQIRGLNADFGTERSVMTVVCECGDGECTEQLQIRTQDYERIRGDSRRYVVAKGHEINDVERVVEQADGYDVVQKREGTPAELARELDPRS
jgi:antibiotic biosynthesis monooxygenase (ABM) superfamily enzyme